MRDLLEFRVGTVEPPAVVDAHTVPPADESLSANVIAGVDLQPGSAAPLCGDVFHEDVRRRRRHRSRHRFSRLCCSGRFDASALATGRCMVRHVLGALLLHGLRQMLRAVPLWIERLDGRLAVRRAAMAGLVHELLIGQRLAVEQRPGWPPGRRLSSRRANLVSPTR
jgi:hypothetical protein